MVGMAGMAEAVDLGQSGVVGAYHPMEPEPAVPPSIEALAAGEQPFVLADDRGTVQQLNEAFRRTYGWKDEDLIGEPLGLILPESFRMSHQLGFSRFQATGSSTILGHPLRLKTRCADGCELLSEHFIVAERRDGGWVFGATLKPLAEGDDGTPP